MNRLTPSRSTPRILLSAGMAFGLAVAMAVMPGVPGVAPAQAQQGEPRAKSDPKAKRAQPTSKQSAAKGQAKPVEAESAAAPGGPPRGAPVFDTEARNAILMDFDTGAVLYEKQADQKVGPASMSKIMTLYMAFEQIKAGRLALEDTLPISDATFKKWNNSGSTMFIPARARVKVEDLIRGIAIQSGNDACVVLAEGLFGSEEAFSVAMTRRAKELGLTGTNLTNATGWPDPDHYMTARDLALLARRLLQDFPDLYKYFAEKEFVYNNIRQGNRNPLLYKETGVDGIKTGHTEEAGYGLAASAQRHGRRLIMVVHGLKNMKHRSAEAERLMDWGFREFNNYALFKKTDKVGDAEVWLGERLRVGLRPQSDAVVTMARAARRELKVQVVTQEPVPAPIVQGQEMGKLVISAPGQEPREVALVAEADVPKLGAFAKLGATLGYLMLGPPK